MTNETRSKRRRRAKPASVRFGLSLIELLLAMAIASIMLAVLWQTMALFTRIFDAGGQSVTEAQVARAVLHRIAADLRSAANPDTVDHAALPDATPSTNKSQSSEGLTSTGNDDAESTRDDGSSAEATEPGAASSPAASRGDPGRPASTDAHASFRDRDSEADEDVSAPMPLFVGDTTRLRFGRHQTLNAYQWQQVVAGEIGARSMQSTQPSLELTTVHYEWLPEEETADTSRLPDEIRTDAEGDTLHGLHRCEWPRHGVELTTLDGTSSGRDFGSASRAAPPESVGEEPSPDRESANEPPSEKPISDDRAWSAWPASLITPSAARNSSLDAFHAAEDRTQDTIQRLHVPEIDALRFRYLADGAWHATWDSRREGRLPEAVEVSLLFDLNADDFTTDVGDVDPNDAFASHEENERQPLGTRYRLVVSLPETDIKETTDAQTSGEGSSSRNVASGSEGI